MRSPIFRAVLIGVCTASAVPAADESEKKTRMKEIIASQVIEDAKKKPAARAVPRKTEETSAAKSETKAEPPPPPEPTVLPQVEVRKSRITELDGEIAEKDREIASEKEKTKATEADRALNSPKLPGILSIFGGRTSERGTALAGERVRLKELERELLEEIKRAKTKKERDELRKQLTELRTIGRELESSGGERSSR